MTAASVIPLLTVGDVADRMHVHPQTVRLWIKHGELGHVQVGRYKHISEDQLAAFIDARRQDV